MKRVLTALCAVGQPDEAMTYAPGQMRKGKDDRNRPELLNTPQCSNPMPRSEMRNRKRERTNLSFALGDTAVARRHRP